MFTQAEGTPFLRSKDTARLQPIDGVWVEETYVNLPIDEGFPLNDGHLGDQH